MRAFPRLRLGSKGIIGLVIVGLVFASALFSPWLAPHSPDKQNLLKTMQPPSWNSEGTIENLLGTDRLGRDILSRIIYGARISLLVAFSAVFLSGLMGSILGLIAGYAGAVTQNVIMRIVDIVLSIPFILLALVVTSVLGSSLFNLILVFVAVRWVQYTRIAFGQTLEVKTEEFVLASRSYGAATPRILFKHIMPNILSSIIVVATLELGFVIIMESGLSFLGLGVPPEIPSWGGMLQEGRSYINLAWWMTTFPGLAIVLTVLGFNFIGDWLREKLDPKASVTD